MFYPVLNAQHWAMALNQLCHPLLLSNDELLQLHIVQLVLLRQQQPSAGVAEVGQR